MFDSKKGYLNIYVKKGEDGYLLSSLDKVITNPDILTFGVDYENGCIFINWDADDPRDVIGYYDVVPDAHNTYRVYDKTKTRVIGRVGDEMIWFRKNEANFSAGQALPEEDVLAYYTKNGSITELRLVPVVGGIFGDVIGGAAAFVAVSFAFNFKSVFYDYFAMDKDEFYKKYASYFDIKLDIPLK